LNKKNIFYLLLISFIFLITACNEDTKEEQKDIILSKDKKNILIENMINNTLYASTDKITNRENNAIENYTFTFKNLNNQTIKLDLKNDLYTFINIKQPIVMINFASTWCPPCRGEVPHLTNLQKKFKQHLFILTALVHDDIKKNELKKLIVSEKAYFFISENRKENERFEKIITKKLGITNNLKLPLMVLFNNGKYFTHYEGSMPEEMIESDIQQLLEEIKR
jgi:thiol-disulfide isomerase/thioredoxin